MELGKAILGSSRLGKRLLRPVCVAGQSQKFPLYAATVTSTNCRNFGNEGRVGTVSENILSRSSSSQVEKYDVAIVGGGIIGLATAMKLITKYPNLKMGVVDKEDQVAKHQSSRNSGVLHAGIYYTPGTLKAILCVKGIRMLYEYLEKNQVPFKKCGKLIVAVSPEEIPRLDKLFANGLKNGIPDLKLIDGHQIKEHEPNCVGLKAIWSPSTGIVDYGEVTKSYARNFTKCGGDIHLNFEVDKFELTDEDKNYPVRVHSRSGKGISAKYVLTCGGLHSDRLSLMSGCNREPRIVPFRGEYLLLKPEKTSLIRGNIYPVNDPRFPFLGVHFTPRMDGSVWLGPNALLAFKREGYSFTDFNLKDFTDSVLFSGFQRLALQYAKFGTNEMIQSVLPRLKLKQLQKYIPTLQYNDIITSGGPAGVRAQAIDNKGNLVDDFIFDSGTGKLSNRVLHARNCPSPACTASLAIAEVIIERMEKQFGIK